MNLGLYSGASAPNALSGALNFYKLQGGAAAQLQFLDPTQSWGAGMANAFYINTCSHSAMAVMSVPMVVGYGSGGSGLGTSPQGPADSAGTGTAATLTITAGSGSGFTFSYNGGAASTVTFPFNATAAQVAAALNATAGITGASVAISPNLGTGTNTYLITFPAGSAIVTGLSPTQGTTTSLLTTTVAGTLTPGATISLADVGSGTWNTLFTSVFSVMAGARNPATSPITLRIGWEMYGSAGFGWPWCTSAQATNHKNAWITLVGLARAVSSSFQFDWNGGVASQYNPITGGAWPGAAYVDYISADVYENQGGNLNGAANWAVCEASLTAGLAFAQANGKPFSIPEFGPWPANGAFWGDDPAWFEAACFWMQANESQLGYVNLYNAGATGATSFDTTYPKSGALVKSMFGGLARRLNGSPARFYTTTGTDRKRAVAA